MKKIIIIWILLFSCLFSLEKDSTMKVYNKILTSLFVKQKPIVYIANKEYKNILKHSDEIIVSDNPKIASIAIVSNKKEVDHIKQVNKNIILFVTQESLLFYDTSVIGAFYWKKGRSQLIFIKDRLDRYHIQLPDEYNQFIIEL